MDDHDTFPTVTVLDTKTGVTRTTNQWNLWHLLEGNFSGCDCNRRLLFRRSWRENGTCVGAHRFLVVDVEPMPPGLTRADFNRGYPEPNTMPTRHPRDRNPCPAEFTCGSCGGVFDRVQWDDNTVCGVCRLGKLPS